MLGYAEKLTRTPWAMTEGDVQALRRAGFGDAAILDIAQVTGYYAFVNRLADGLGVELEEEMEAGEQAGKAATGDGATGREERARSGGRSGRPREG
jgi:uncharacterized protein YciW